MEGFIIGQATFPAREIEPGLYLVATPIGNLGDMTVRGLEVLASADTIACEDTRVTGKLLKHFAIATRMTAYHEHNADKAGPKLLEMLREGARVALVSDAGTPLVSDPGYRLVEAARAEGLPVWPVPGASAPIAALAASGMPSDTFLFDGFLPTKTNARRKRLGELRDIPATLIFFESPNRLAECLADIAAELGETRRLAVCRELTKLHEEVRSGGAGELAQAYAGQKVKGEIVLVLAPPADDETNAIDTDALLAELLETASVSRAAAQAAELTGRPRRELYQRALELSGGKRKK
ncbi:MAG: 16S rRNA (cytidine(1402)-2'-O)-methyltransferase [Nitratireductor sp.]|nr:16S rRNA (cytidine(1402)-2'-O)-methyltransferase [Nitratireductor sp.]